MPILDNRYGPTYNSMIILRIFIGLVFVVSGAGKLLTHYQNFLYAVQAYQLLPTWAEVAVARVLPWIELFTGLFLVLGLWGRQAAMAAMVLFAVFVTVVGQALLRGLPLEQCGCFGELVHIPARWIIVADSLSLLLTIWMLRNWSKAQKFSLDLYLDNEQ